MGREIHFKQMDPYFVSLIIRYCHEGRFSIDILRKSHLTVLEVAKELDVPGLIAICEAWGMGGGGLISPSFDYKTIPEELKNEKETQDYLKAPSSQEVNIKNGKKMSFK